MKKIINVFIGIVLMTVVLVLGKNVIAKAAIENGVRIVTGLPLRMEKFEFGLRKGYVRMEGFELHNPESFSEKIMVSIPKIYVQIEPAALFKGKVHVIDIELHLKEFNVVKNQQGILNLDSLKAVAESKKETASSHESKSTAPGKSPEIKIDQLELRIEKVSYKDYSGNQPIVQDFYINLNEAYKNISNLNAVVSLIVVKVMMNTTIGSLAHFELGNLQSSVSSVMNSSVELAANAVSKAEGLITNQARKVLEKAPMLQEATSLLGNEAKSLTGGLSNAAGNLKGKLPSFGFGRKKEQ
ncbi:MAG: AsmA family protein [Candidatus Omnitrophica bacterium]|nr:AsmA family protein [Candidatus Omnitrophota bacterium]